MKKITRNALIAVMVMFLTLLIGYSIHLVTTPPSYKLKKAAIGKVVVSPDKTYGDNQKGIRVSVYKEKLISFDEPDNQSWVMAEEEKVMGLVTFINSKTEITINKRRALKKDLKDLDGKGNLLVIAYYKESKEPADRIEVTSLK